MFNPPQRFDRRQAGMLAGTTTGQDVQLVFAFKKAPVEVFLITGDEAIVSWGTSFAVKHSFAYVKDSGLKSLLPYFTLLGLAKQEVEQHPIPNNTKWLTLELLARQLNELTVFKLRASEHLGGAIQHIFNQI
nr:hypothetical protein [Pseudomonas mandelii]